MFVSHFVVILLFCVFDCKSVFEGLGLECTCELFL